MIETLLIVSCILASWSLLLSLWNCFLFKVPKDCHKNLDVAVSVLIPARNEEGNISAVIDSVLASRNVDLELIVLDDCSTDRTVEIVKQYQQKDDRVYLKTSSGLPPGWIGKEYACHLLSQQSSHELMLFLDADVRLTPLAIANMVNQLDQQNIQFLSGFPKLITVTFAERLVIPMIDFILLGYLPLIALSKTHHAAFAAANGQLILVRKSAYIKAGGHEANALKMHDGLALARNFKKNKLPASICNARKIAQSRMYHNFDEVWKGFAKNATEGMATKTGLPIWTILLFMGHIFSVILFPFLWQTGSDLALLAGVAIILSLLQRGVILLFLRQPLFLLIFHQLSIIVVLAIQWRAFIRAMKAIPSQWRGRDYKMKI